MLRIRMRLEGTHEHLLVSDESSADVFAFSVDPTGQNNPPVTLHTDWIFMEAMDTLRFPDPWDIDDFQHVLNHLRSDEYYLFEGELIEPLRPGEASRFVTRLLGSWPWRTRA